MQRSSARLERASEPVTRRALRKSTEGLSWPPWFSVNGRLDDTAVHSRWAHGRLDMSAALRRRCDLLVAMDEVFDGSCFDKSSQRRATEGLAEFWRLAAGRALSVAAGLSEPLPALLTSLRALDGVASVEVGLPGSVRPWVWPPRVSAGR